MKFPVWLAVVLACGGPSAPAHPNADDPATAFQALENRLLDAEHLEIEAEIEATGAIEASLRGTVELSGDAVASLRFEGSFAGKPVTVSLDSDGEVMQGTYDNLRWTQPTPPDLNDALMLGLTRMGLLHNLAVMTAGRPPQGTYGKAPDWVQAIDIAHGKRARGTRGFQFAIRVQGERTGEATLDVDDRRLPARRRQTVHFPGGDMTVVERYSSFAVR